MFQCDNWLSWHLYNGYSTGFHKTFTSEIIPLKKKLTMMPVIFVIVTFKWISLRHKSSILTYHASSKEKVLILLLGMVPLPKAKQAVIVLILFYDQYVFQSMYITQNSYFCGYFCIIWIKDMKLIQLEIL